MACSQRRCENHQGRARYTSGALAGDQQHRQQAKLVGPVERSARRLRQEDRRRGKVEARSVVIEGIGGWKHKADHLLTYTELRQFLGQLRKHRLRRTGADDEEELGADIAHQPGQAESRPERHRPQHQQDEQRAGGIKLRDEAAERCERAEPELTDGESHRAKGRNRREAHRESDDPEQRLGRSLDQTEDGLSGIARGGEADGEQHREEQNFEDVALGKTVDRGGRDHVEQKLDGAYRFVAVAGCVGRDQIAVEQSGVDMHSRSGLP